MNEIKNLRKALNPQSEQVFSELKKFDEIKRQQEEELVRVHIENDRLKVTTLMFVMFVSNIFLLNVLLSP
jgi:hypothetical protein